MIATLATRDILRSRPTGGTGGPSRRRCVATGVAVDSDAGVPTTWALPRARRARARYRCRRLTRLLARSAAIQTRGRPDGRVERLVRRLLERGARDSAWSFNDLIRTQQHRWRDRESEVLGRLEVDRELELR